jgi:hypothetical protein
VNGATNPFSIADRLLAGIELTASQGAQLRAINHKYQTRVFALTRGSGGATVGESDVLPRELTAAEADQLREMIIADLLEMLTPEQRARVKV